MLVSYSPPVLALFYDLHGNELEKNSVEISFWKTVHFRD